jgi:cysteine peptidase B
MSKSLLCAIALVAGASASSHSFESQKQLFETFKKDYDKTYANKVEEMERFDIFIKNLEVIEERNAKDPTASHGITKFTDLTQAEFKKHFANYKPLKNGRGMKHGKYDFDLEGEVDATQDLVDWTNVYTTPVKNQGYCGSCWAFSATEQIESDYIRTQQAPLSSIFATQQMNSCTDYALSYSLSYSYDAGGGCDGGLTEFGFMYAMDGMELDFYYPYTSGEAGVTGDCTADPSKYVVRTTSYTTISNSSEGEAVMANYVQNTGPLSICVDASEWASYTGGIMSVCGDDVDHCVQAVGINMGEGYWKVRNSWGPDWAEDGFIRLSYGNNTCQIASDAIYVDVEPM